MPAITDPYPALLSFQKGINSNGLILRPGRYHHELYWHYDKPQNQGRFTYALMDGKTVKGIMQFCEDGLYEGNPIFHLGCAVAEPYRNQGIARALALLSMSEFKLCFPIPPGRRLYFAAVIGKGNIASIKSAAKTFDVEPVEIVDCYSGEPAVHYLIKIEPQP